MKRKIFFAVTAALVLLAIFLPMGNAFAKYIRTFETQGTVQTTPFYFESDLLAETTPEYELNPGVDTIDFALKNYIDTLRVCALDVNYTVTVDCVDDDSGATVKNASNASSGTLTKTVKIDEKITLSGMQNGGTYIVTAVGSNGYTKTISARITIKKPKEVAYKYLQYMGDGVYHLTIWTEDTYSDDVTVTFPLGLLLDNTYEDMKNALNDLDLDKRIFSTKLQKNHSYEYRFFIDEAEDENKGEGYTADDFKVYLSSEISDAEIATPN